MKNTKVDTFKKELSELLSKFDASIDVGYNGTIESGHYDECMEVSLKETDGSFVTKKICNGWDIDSEKLN